MSLTGKCEGCKNVAPEGEISFVCLTCKREYFPNMDGEPYERKSDKYEVAGDDAGRK